MLLGVSDVQLLHVIVNPGFRAQVKNSFNGRHPGIATISKELWVERESAVLLRLIELSLEVGSSMQHVTSAWREDFTVHHRYIPAGFTRSNLLSAFVLLDASPIKQQLKQAVDSFSTTLPTEAGVLISDLEKIGRPTDAQHRPFGLERDEQEIWSKDQGGDGLLSAEEVLYLFLRSRIELGFIPIVGIWIGCQNSSHSQYGQLGVIFDTCYLGLCAHYKDAGNGRNWACVARKFIYIL